MKIKYSITGGFDESQMQQIHQTALKILDEIGVEIRANEIATPELLKIITSHSGVHIKNGRLCFSPWLVEKYVSALREDLKRERSTASDEVIIQPIIHTLNFLAPGADKVRPHDTASLIDSAKLIDALHDQGVRGGCPGWPSEVPPLLQPLMHYKISCQYTRNPPLPPQTSTQIVPYLCDMARVVGQASGDSISVGFHPISPLKLEGDEFEIAIHYWKKFGNKLSLWVGPMPIMGVSTAIFFPAALAQSLAEALAAFTFFKLLMEGGNVFFSFNYYPFDMKYGTFAQGGPEDVLIALMRSQLSQWYGFEPNPGDKAFLTLGHLPDAQAASEKTAKTVVSLLAGATRLNGAGSLSLDETFSPEQLLIDLEIASWAKRVSQGFDFSEEYLGYKILREVIEQKTDFLSHESTVRHHRDVYWTPEIFEHLMLNQRIEKGLKTFREQISDRVGQIIAGHTSPLKPDQIAELDRIYQKAQKDITLI